jgi:hypothetical protein
LGGGELSAKKHENALFLLMLAKNIFFLVGMTKTYHAALFFKFLSLVTILIVQFYSFSCGQLLGELAPLLRPPNEETAQGKLQPERKHGATRVRVLDHAFLV